MQTATFGTASQRGFLLRNAILPQSGPHVARRVTHCLLVEFRTRPAGDATHSQSGRQDKTSTVVDDTTAPGETPHVACWKTERLSAMRAAALSCGRAGIRTDRFDRLRTGFSGKKHYAPARLLSRQQQQRDLARARRSGEQDARQKIYRRSMEQFDQVRSDLNTKDYTRWAREQYAVEKIVVERFGLKQ